MGGFHDCLEDSVIVFIFVLMFWSGLACGVQCECERGLFRSVEI